MIQDKIDMLSAQFEEWYGDAFYEYIFPNNECQGEMHSDYSHPNAVYLYQDEAVGRMKRRAMLKDTWKEDYVSFVEANPMTLCGGLTYRKNINKLENAQNMNAMIFDLDAVDGRRLNIVLRRIFEEIPPNKQHHEIIGNIPKPTFIVVSGSGIHLYYVFEEPIPLFPHIKLQLKSMKYALTSRIWDYKGTSNLEQVQYQGINQGFRMVGSLNDKHGNVVRAFKTGDRVTLDYLNNYVIDKKDRVDIMQRFKPSRCTKEQAKELYPDWYERVVVRGLSSGGKWNIGYRKKKKVKDFKLYEWWLDKVENAQPGHRYHYMLCTVVYAVKNGVPKKQVKEDLMERFETLRGIKHENELTIQDVKDALEIYSKEYYHYTISDIEKMSALKIERNRRNYRNQELHLKRARAVRDVMHDNWREGNGRKPLAEVVKIWRMENPNGTKAECIRDTGLSKPTVYKWW